MSQPTQEISMPSGDSTSTADRIALVALAYALLGAVGLTLAIPPGYASPVFPASGLALACVLWFGRRVLIGVWLGSALLNLSHAWLNGTYGPTTAIVAPLIATGAALQAWAGSWLVNRGMGPAWRDLIREQDSFRFLLLGGILACVLSAAIGVSGLSFLGIIERNEVLFSWWTWYVGDAMGVLVFAPLTFCILNRSEGLWGERRRRIVTPMLLILCLVWTAFYGTTRWERQTMDGQLRTDAASIAKRIEDRLITQREVLSSLKRYIEATPGFSFKQFELYTRIALQDNPDISALSFNDIVPDQKRSVFEQMMSTLSPLGPFRITERDSLQRLVPAAKRPEYVAISYIVPLAENRTAVGYDIHSDPIRREAIERARKTGSMAVTAPIHLVQDQKKRVSLLQLLPVEHVSLHDAGDVEADLMGFAVAVLKIDQLIEVATMGRTPIGLAFQLTDTRAPEGLNLLYRFDPRDPARVPPIQAADWKTGMRMGDRDWELSVFVTKSYRQKHKQWAAWAVGVAGLILATLLQILMLGMTGRSAVILRKNEQINSLARTLEQKVTDRTAQLSEANRELTQEIIDRRAAEKALQEAKERVLLLLNSTAEGIYGIDLQGNCTFVNPSGLRMLGYAEAEDLLGRNMHELVHHSRRDGAPFPVQECSVHNALCDRMGAHRDDEVFWRADGSAIPVEYWSYPQIVNGEVTGAVVAFVDITERKEAEQEIIREKELAQAATKAKSEFLASMSHEIRTPMNAIIGMADLLGESPLNREQQKYVRIFRSASEDLLTLINDILDISKVESGLLQLDITTFDLGELMEKICEVMAIRSHGKGLELACMLDPGLPCSLAGDPLRLRQILINLIGNAIKFTEKGEIVVSVKEVPSDAPRQAGEEAGSVLLQFSVRDTGIGIPADKVDAIFDKFTQADSSITRKYGGSGLGLTISKNLVTLMGGRIWVESEVGKGATFHFTAPFTVQETGSQEAAMLCRNVDLTGTRVLIIDDNATNRLILQRILGGWGAMLTEVDSGAGGIVALRQHQEAGKPFDLVFLDNRMPEMSGFSVAEAIRKDRKLAGMTVVMLTSEDRSGDIARANDLGLAAYLVKPVKRSELLEVIQSTLDRKGSICEMPSVAEETPVEQHDLRILLVDDSADNRLLIQAYLKKTPHTVEEAENGEIAVDKFKKGAYNIILMDMQMPVMDGYTATRTIRAWEMEQRRPATPIVALTAYALKDDERKSMEAGCTAHLTKPIKKQDLLSALQRFASGG